MNFYYSMYQLIESVDQMEKDVQHLAGGALHSSPRDAMANRKLLEECIAKMREAKNILHNKTHINKVMLHKPSVLFQVLEANYRRVLHLSGAASNAGSGDDEDCMKAIWQLLSLARDHYQTILKSINELTGVPVSLSLSGVEEKTGQGLSEVLQKELGYQMETLKLLEKAIEVSGGELDLAETLVQMRKELIDAKRRLKNQTLAAEKAEIPKAYALPLKMATQPPVP